MRWKLVSIAVASMLMVIAGFGVRAQDATAEPTEEPTAEVVAETVAEEPVVDATEALIADTATTTTLDAKLDTTWILIAGFLVFFKPVSPFWRRVWYAKRVWSMPC
jgi:hypothetical protein